MTDRSAMAHTCQLFIFSFALAHLPKMPSLKPPIPPRLLIPGGGQGSGPWQWARGALSHLYTRRIKEKGRKPGVFF